MFSFIGRVLCSWGFHKKGNVVTVHFDGRPAEYPCAREGCDGFYQDDNEVGDTWQQA